MDILRKMLSREKVVKFDIKSVYEGHHNITYRGIPTIKCPFDYVIYQMLIMELKPDLIIEIGTNFGGSALYMADLMNIINYGAIHTIDIKPPSEIVSKHPRIRCFSDGWQGYELGQAEGFSKVMVIDDASHTYKDTFGTLSKFSSIVSKNSYFIVEDGIINKLGMSKAYAGGPLRAIKEFLNTDSSFEIDKKWCNFFGQNATFNVNGYLKKIE